MSGTEQQENKMFNDWESARVSQLVSYMTDCQQGIRDVNGQILSTIAVTGSMLTLFFGVSLFGNKIGNSNTNNKGIILDLPDYGNSILGRACTILEQMLTVRRIAFWFTSAIFLIAVLYIVELGIGNVLRYHYCQYLSDRLHSLIKGARDDEGRNALVTFEQFSSPVTTYNLAHVNNSHNVFNFTAHYLAGLLATIFCIGSILTQFVLLETNRWYDKFVLTLVGLTLLISIILFIRFNWHSEEVSDMAFIVANENLEVRKGLVKEELYRNAKNFQSALIYLLFPRRHVLQKDALIIGGFLAVSIIQGDCHPMHLAFILIVYSFLLCQARYQINDLWGLEDDEKAGRTDRLNAQGNVNKTYLINVSMVVCLLRIMLAILLTLFQGRVLKPDIFLCGGLLFLATALYEFVRGKKYGWLTIFLVGAGYPLRVYVGAVAQNKDIVSKVPLIDMIFLAIIFWLWGITGSLMAWAREVENLIQTGKMQTGTHPKRHYEILYYYVSPKLKKGQEGLQDKHPTVLLSEYNVKDPWNISFWAMLVMVGVEICLHHSNNLCLVIVELLMVLICGFSSFEKSFRGIISLSGIWLIIGIAVYTIHRITGSQLFPNMFWIIIAFSTTISVLFIRCTPETTIRQVISKCVYLLKKSLFGKYSADESSIK